jgi:hypothetical protein
VGGTPRDVARMSNGQKRFELSAGGLPSGEHEWIVRATDSKGSEQTTMSNTEECP